MTIKSGKKKKKSTWKAESVIGWSAAQRELGGSGCPNCDPMAKLHREVEIEGGGAPTEVRLCLIYCTQVRPPGRLEVTEKKGRRGEMFPHFSSSVSVQPPEQTTGSHRTEFVFDVRQFGVLQRAQLHFSTPPTPSPLQRAAKNHKQEIPQRKKTRKKKKKSILQPSISTILVKCKMCIFNM